MVPLFALVAQAHADTVVARIVPQPLTGFELSMVIIGGVAVLLPYLFFGATIWFAVRVHRGIVAARASLDELSRNVNALSESANRPSLAASAERIARALFIASRKIVMLRRDDSPWLSRRIRSDCTWSAPLTGSFRTMKPRSA